MSDRLKQGKRLEEIVALLGKYGLADWLPRRGPDMIQRLLRSAEGERLSQFTREQRIRMVLTELGPTFIKLGQMFSTRADLVGPELANELTALQANTPSDPPETVHSIISAELGRPVETLFAAFDDRPMASASIGQVHCATLHDGRDVVVKVQHPDIAERITRDLEILGYLAGLAERHSSELRPFRPRAIVSQFRRSILRELDFSREGANLERFRGNFANDPSVRIPEPVNELSSARVLTMERLAGLPLSDPEALEHAQIDTAEVARRGALLYLEMIFRDGQYHADPHPGNIIVMPGTVIGLLDFGRVGQIDRETRREFEELVIAALEGDGSQMTVVITRLCEVPPGLDADALRAHVTEFASDYLNVSLQRFDLTAALLEMMAIIRSHRLILPSSVSLLIKVLAQLEGTSRLLQREFNLAELLRPYYARAAASRWAPARLATAVRHSFRDWSRLIDTLPRDLSLLLERARAGSLDVHLQHRRLDTTVNRLVHGILTASLVLASAQLLSREVPPLFFGVSSLGLAAGVLAVALGLRLFVAIRRSGGL